MRARLQTHPISKTRAHPAIGKVPFLRCKVHPKARHALQVCWPGRRPGGPSSGLHSTSRTKSDPALHRSRRVRTQPGVSCSKHEETALRHQPRPLNTQREPRPPTLPRLLAAHSPRPAAGRLGTAGGLDGSPSLLPPLRLPLLLLLAESLRRGIHELRLGGVHAPRSGGVHVPRTSGMPGCAGTPRHHAPPRRHARLLGGNTPKRLHDGAPRHRISDNQQVQGTC